MLDQPRREQAYNAAHVLDAVVVWQGPAHATWVHEGVSGCSEGRLNLMHCAAALLAALRACCCASRTCTRHGAWSGDRLVAVNVSPQNAQHAQQVVVVAFDKLPNANHNIEFSVLEPLQDGSLVCLAVSRTRQEKALFGMQTA